MFFLLSKSMSFILTPSNLLVLVALAGLIFLLFRRSNSGLAFLTIGILGLVLAGWSPIGPIALMALEERFPKIDPPPVVTGLIMLGGAVDIHITQARGTEAWNDQAERITAVAELARTFPTARIILSGGSGHLNAISESSIAKHSLVTMGVSDSRIELETRSRNTCENATESALTASPKFGEVWLLVTSASHMPRAIACFRAANFKVIPYPVDYHTRGLEDIKRMQHSITDGLAETDLAAHEWVGLITYRLSGMTKELFPSPSRDGSE